MSEATRLVRAMSRSFVYVSLAIYRGTVGDICVYVFSVQLEEGVAAVVAAAAAELFRQW